MTRKRSDDLPTCRTCSHPGCTNRMWIGSSTYDAGLCRDHGGRRSGKAAVTEMVPVPIDPPRPGVRVVEVPFATGNSGINGRVRVSLAREPWE
jgi:hypothetical protein